MKRRLPSGRVTFAFVDVVESTKTFAEHGDAFVAALAVLQERVARHTAAVGGSVVKTEGDGAFLAFGTGSAAIRALVGLQEELEQVPSEAVPRLSVRAGAHTGDAVPVADDYVALAVNVAARVTSTAGAGQVVVSAATQAELAVPVGVCAGDYDLKDVADPLELWRVCGDKTPLRASPSRRTNVQQPVTGFIGRGGELTELRDLVQSHRIVTVLGPGGLGKTRLVSEMMLQIASGVRGGAWLVELASLSAADQIPTAVAQVLGIHQGGNVETIAAEVSRRGEVLLALDNCEHLLEPVADLVADLQAACPGLTLLCTSREPLQVAGERVWRLPPLNDRAAQFELFTQRAWASGATVSDESAEVVNQLCTALDGLPLAIELAATQSASTTLNELVKIAEQGTDGLPRRGGGQSRQRSLDAVLAWSLGCLPTPQRASLLVLSALPGRFDLEMATAILTTVPSCEVDAVRSLSRASLIDLDGETYRLLDTIRHAARRRLASDPDLSAAARLGLRAWATDLAASLYTSRQRYDEVQSDRLLALEVALEQAMDDNAPNLGKLWKLVRNISAFREPSARIGALADRLLRSELQAEADALRSVTSAMDLLFRLGADLPVPVALLEALCDAAETSGPTRESADLRYELACYFADRGDVAPARRHADAFALYAATGDGAEDASGLPPSDAVHLLSGFIAYAAGDFRAALVHAERLLSAVRASGNSFNLDVAEGNVAEALLDLGRPDEALPHALEAVRLSPLPRAGRRFMLLQLARAHQQLGDIDAALSTAREIQAELVASGRSPEQIQSELERLRQHVPGFEASPT